MCFTITSHTLPTPPFFYSQPKSASSSFDRASAAFLNAGEQTPVQESPRAAEDRVIFSATSCCASTSPSRGLKSTRGRIRSTPERSAAVLHNSDHRRRHLPVRAR